jgi:hypothetical protein
MSFTFTVTKEPERISRSKTFHEWKDCRIEKEEVERRFETWCAQDLSLVFAHEGTVIERLASKRGNRIYAWNLRARLDSIASYLTPKIRVSRGRTNAVFVTLTDPNVRAAPEAWLDIGERWNRFLANVRKGHELLYVRSWESTQNGFPHVHALLVFADHDFRTFLHWSKSNRWISRVKGSTRTKWRGYWGAHVDVQGVESVQGAAWYITKEVLKYEAQAQKRSDPKGRLTLALLWASGRRSFSCSQAITRAVHAESESNPSHSEIGRVARSGASLVSAEESLSAVSRGEPGRAELASRPAEPARLDAIQESKSNSNSLAVIGLTIPNFDRSKLKFLGIGRRCDVLKLRKPGAIDGAWSYELIGVPEGLLDPHRPKALTFTEEKELIARGRPMVNSNSLEPFIEEYRDVFDELTTRARASVRRAVKAELKGRYRDVCHECLTDHAELDPLAPWCPGRPTT